MLEFLAAFILLLLGLLYFKRSRQTNTKTAPGPKGIPVFGSLFQMDYTNMQLTLDSFSRQYGDIVQITILGQTLICLNSSEIIRDAFLHEPNASLTAARPISAFGKYGLDNYSDVAFGSLSKKWTKCRKLSYKLINAYGEGLIHMEKEIITSLTVMKEGMISLDGTTMCPEDFVENFLLDVLETMMIGRSSSRHGELQRLLKDIDFNINAMANMGMDVLYTLLPFLRFLPLKHSRMYTLFESQKIQLMDSLAKTSIVTGYVYFSRPMKTNETIEMRLNVYEEFSTTSCFKHALNNTDQSINRRNTQKENPNAKGIYTELMEVMKDQDQHELSYNNIRGILLDIVAGGYNTTRGALLSLVHILAKRPELQKTLQAEVDNVIGSGRMPSLQDRENCPMIAAVLLETLRYISHIPLAILHSVSESCEINAYFVEKNATIIPNLWTAHRNNKEWNKPGEFVPERFLDKSGGLLPSTDSVRKHFLAFGCGKRSCIGEVFAKSRMFLFIATLMQTVTIEEPDDSKLPEFTMKEMLPGLIMQPKPYRVKYVLRK